MFVQTPEVAIRSFFGLCKGLVMRYSLVPLFASATAIFMGCGGTSDGTGGGGGRYADEAMWLCRPGIAEDQCALADLSITEIHADGSSAVADGPTVNPDAPFDCFVVYETVDMSMEPGNTLEPSATDEAVLEALYRNGVRLRGTCRMYAPLYRQMTLGTYYDDDPWEDTPYFEMAYGDIADAFDHYMRDHNQGRDIVLIGHSQGAHVLARLMEDEIDGDAALRGQLISALLIGPGERVYVPDGELVGGNFETIPLCSSANDTGCVIAFDSLPFVGASAEVAAASKQLPTGYTRACVNPASFDNQRAALAGAAFSRSSVWAPQALNDAPVTTEWVSYPEAFNALCAVFLWIGVADDSIAPFTPAELQVEHQQTLDAWVGEERSESPGLHWANFSFNALDLVRVVETQAAAR